MRLIGRKILEQFARRHADVRGQLDVWAAEVEEAEWQTPSEIKARYASASFVSNRVIFNLKGNKYRLDTKISFKSQLVLIMRIGTHEEYSTWKF